MKLSRILIVTSAFSALSLALIFSACKKDSNSGSSTANETDAVSLSSSSATADNQYNDVLNMALETGVDGSTAPTGFSSGVYSGSGSPVQVTGGNGSIPTCAVINVSPADTVSYPKTVSIDFGTGCTDDNGVTRKGKITYVFSGKILSPGTTVSVSFSGYSVAGYQLAGTYSITNNSSGNGISFVTTITGGQITFPDASYYSYAGTRTVTQTAGVGTLTILDNVFSITGSHSYSSSAGKSLVDSITTPLVWKTTCRHIVSGVIGFTYSYNGISMKGTLDYGSGDCDSLATIKVGATTKTVGLP
jgi:hypothetical protein